MIVLFFFFFFWCIFVHNLQTKPYLSVKLQVISDVHVQGYAHNSIFAHVIE